MIDQYCERIEPGFWNEPFNALTNLAFIFAAMFAFRLAHRRGTLVPEVGLLIGLIVAIGVGSFLFHTFATAWAMAMDVIPILLFQVAYLWIHSGRVVGLGSYSRTAAVTLLILGIYASGHFVDLLNGSLSYLPAFFAIAILAVLHYQRAVEGRNLLLMATGVLSLSLAFRTVDNMLCDQIGFGTHLFWHLLNGVVLYLAIKALILNVGSMERRQGAT